MVEFNDASNKLFNSERITPALSLGTRIVGRQHPPLVIAEIGINHGGDLEKAVQMVDDAREAGCECVKFQTHVVSDEMIKTDVVPGNATEPIWDIINRCALTLEEEIYLKDYVEKKNMIFLSTPFSRAAADQLESMGVVAYKIGSGECNNFPLISHISEFGKPIILSTGMNNMESIASAVHILRGNKVDFALLHCTSIYPTPYDQVRLGSLGQMSDEFPDAVIGLSDHSIGNYTCYAAVALGHGAILEKHFTSTYDWPGPDIGLSILPEDLKQLIDGSSAIQRALGGEKTILSDEAPTIAFAYASIVSTKMIEAGELFSKENIWVKRPGTGEILAKEFESILGRIAKTDIPPDTQIARDMICE